MIGVIVLVILVILIFVGLKNKKKIAAERQKAAAEKATTEKATTEKAAANLQNTQELYQEIEKDCKEVFDNCSSCEPNDLIEEFHKCFESKKSDYANMLTGKNISDSSNSLNLMDSFYESKYMSDATYKAKDIFCEVLYDNYFDNLRSLLVDTFDKILNKKRNIRCEISGADKYMIIAANQAAAITLRALNFEKNSQNKEEYSDITEDTCREFISKHEIFKNEDENKVATALISEISGNLSGGGHWYLPYDLKVYHIDAVCYAFWKSVAEKYQDGDSTDPNYIFNMFLDYFKPNQDQLDYLAAKHRQHMELEARREAVRRQCNSCARYEECCERNKRENCPAWIPKQR